LIIVKYSKIWRFSRDRRSYALFQPQILNERSREMLKRVLYSLPTLLAFSALAQAQPMSPRQPVAREGTTNATPSLQSWKPSNIQNPISAEELIGTRVSDRNGKPMGVVRDIVVGSSGHRIEGLQLAPYYMIPWQKVAISRSNDQLKVTAQTDPVRLDPASFADNDANRVGTQAKLFHASELRSKYVLLNGGIRFGRVSDVVFDGTGELAAAETWLAYQPTPPEQFYAGALSMGSYMLPVPQGAPIEPDLAYLVLPYDLNAVQDASPRAELDSQPGLIHSAEASSTAAPDKAAGQSGSSGSPSGSTPQAGAARPLALDQSSGQFQGTPGNYAGTYRLVSINGRHLPYDLPGKEGCNVSLVSGALELWRDDTYLAKSLVREDCRENSTLRQTVNQRGSWSYADNKLTLQQEQAGSGSSAGEPAAAPLRGLGGMAEQDGTQLTLQLADGTKATFEPTDAAGLNR
jgi:sporulation protein YlmC with PRC-barrel domain